MARREGKSRGFWIGLICFILVAAIIVGVFGVGTTGFKDWSFSRWFPKSGKGQQEAAAGGTIISREENYGVSLASMEIPVEDYAVYGVDRAVQNAYSLTATFIPENTTFQEVDYSLYFDTASKPEYATWAEGKDMTAYAEITQNEEDSRKATVMFKYPFSAPIMVKATSRRNTQIFATIRADYVHNYFYIDSADMGHFEDIHTSPAEEGAQIIWVGGTITPTASESVLGYRYKFPNYFVSNMKAKGYTVNSYYLCELKVDEDWVLTEDFPTVREMLIKIGGTAAETNLNAYWGAVGESILNGSTPEEMEGSELCEYDSKFKRVHNGTVYSNSLNDMDCGSSVDLQDWSGFEIRATNMGVTEDGGSSSIVLG